jgi:hypothetical protein
VLGSATSTVLYSSKLNAFAQKSQNSPLQSGDQATMDQLSSLIQNKTGIQKLFVKSIFEQIAVQILDRHEDIN